MSSKAYYANGNLASDTDAMNWVTNYEYDLNDNVRVGDQVRATDPTTGQTAAKPVTALHVNQDKDLTNVTIQNSTSGKTTTLRTTQHHPFWDNTAQRWIDAAELTTGHKLLVADDEQPRQPKGDNTGAGLGGGGPGTTATITHVANFNDDKTMHDLTIADIHTYYVIAGQTPVLVHNCGGSDPDHADSCRCVNGASPRMAVEEAK